MTGFLGGLALAVSLHPAQAQNAPSGTVVGMPAEDVQNGSVLIEADTLIDRREENLVIAEGDVVARYGLRELRADKIIYDTSLGTVRAVGNVSIAEPDGSVRYADDIEVDERLSEGVAAPFASRLQPQGRVVAAAANRTGSSVNELTNAVYTACDVCIEGDDDRPTWALRARRVTQNVESGMITYRDAVFEVWGVPVFYTPYFAHPDPSAGRRSGLLPPDFGRSSGVGWHYEQPYYWAIGSSQEMIAGLQLNQNVNPSGTFYHRKRFYSGFVESQGSFTMEQEFNTDGERLDNTEDTFRGHLFSRGRFAITPNLDWGYGLETVSDDLYIFRYDFSGEGEMRGPFLSQSRRLLSQLYTERQTDSSFMRGSVLYFQGLRSGDDDKTFPQFTPLFEAYQSWDDPILGGDLTASVSGVMLNRTGRSSARANLDPAIELGQDSARLSAGLDWRRSFVSGPGVLLEPFGYARGDFYSITDRIELDGAGDPVSVEDESVLRGDSGVGLEMRWPLVNTQDYGQLLIEPIVNGVLSPTGANNQIIPNEDAQAITLDESNLFDVDPVAGSDLYLTGPRASAGVRMSALLDNGASASMFFGRQWRENGDDPFDRQSNLDGSVSDYIISGDLSTGRFLSLNADARLDKETGKLLRMDAATSMRLTNRIRLNARYTEVDGDLRLEGDEREVLSSVFARLTDRWSVTYGVRRDLDDAVNLREALGVGYNDGCTDIRIIYERNQTQDRAVGDLDAIRVQIGLATLGGMR